MGIYTAKRKDDGTRISYFKTSWNLDDIAYERVQVAARRLCKKGILIRPVVDGKKLQGTYKYNPDYGKNTKISKI